MPLRCVCLENESKDYLGAWPITIGEARGFRFAAAEKEGRRAVNVKVYGGFGGGGGERLRLMVCG